MATMGLDSKLDRAPDLPDVSWPSSAAYAGAQVLAAGRHLKPTIKERVFFIDLSDSKSKRNSNANRDGCICNMYLSRKLWRGEFTCDLSLEILCI